MPIAGQVLEGGIKLVRLLGRGSHSVVYFAVTVQGQSCAVKVFPLDFRAFAEREYRHGQALQHPRLAPVLGYTHVGDVPALVVKHAKGDTLFHRYQQRPALQHERRAYLLTLTHVLDALDFMHRQGLVHRDIKPDNILVEEDGSAKLVDYDLAGPAYEALSVPTRMGTQAFQSPEAEQGEPLGPESDLYGVGVLLGWGLYGQLSDTTETDNAKSLVTAVPDLSADPLLGLFYKLTEPNRQKRPSSAAAVKEELLSLGLPHPE